MTNKNVGEQSLSIDDQIQIVAKRMREAESRSDYIEAEKERVLLGTLRYRLRSPNEDEFKQRWQLNLVEVEHDHATKVRHFDAIWSARMAEHNEKQIVHLRALNAKHHCQIRDLRDVEDSKTRFPKWSSSLLDLRKRQYLLGNSAI